MAAGTPRHRAAIWRRRSGALLASGLGLTMAVAWYHFQGLASDAMTLGSLAVGIVLFGLGIAAGRKARSAELNPVGPDGR